jgi:tRNA pseudouridine38-40 synthase
MRTLKLTLAYDGTSYVGWQRQINGPSIQGIVEDAFVPLLGDASRRPTIAGAGRTDAGVHAIGQVASVHVDVPFEPPAIGRALNVRLPPDVRVLAVEEAPPGFHAQFHARGKVYRYRICTSPVLSPFIRWFAWHVPARLDVGAIRHAAAALVGRHDFRSFQARGSATIDTIRTIDRLAIEERADEIVIEVGGNGFLRHMVRAIAGTLVEIGAGSRDRDSMAAILDARARQAAGATAPAAGLTLVAVRYAVPDPGQNC